MIPDLGSLEARASEHMDAAAFAYAAAGAYDERTAAGNVAAWEQMWLRPRVLRDVSTVSTEANVLGEPVALPVLAAQTAMHTLFWPDGEIATARAVNAAGTVMIVSMAATTSIEAVAAAVPGARVWMHVTMLRDRTRTRALCERARASECEAIVLTVDCPVATRRPRLEQAGIAFPAGASFPNLLGPDVPLDAELLAAVGDFDRAVTFDDIALISEWSGGLPVLVKGVVRGDDARQCVDAGAAGIIVSNHGGRQLDQCVPTALALPEVVDAVHGRVDVLVDGGIRRGAHVIAALAMGATAVLAGRQLVYGLALEGEAGVAGVLAAFRAEIEAVMAHCGARSIADLAPDLIWPPDLRPA
jgi:4-hydroxymandelate oxidase